MMTTLDEIEKRAQAATPGPWDVGIKDPEIDPIEWYQGRNAFDVEMDTWIVWCPEHPKTRGTHPRPEHSVLTAITGNGEDSQINAEFIAAARSDVPLLCRALRRAAHAHVVMFIGSAEPDTEIVRKVAERWLQEAQE